MLGMGKKKMNDRGATYIDYGNTDPSTSDSIPNATEKAYWLISWNLGPIHLIHIRDVLQQGDCIIPEDDLAGPHPSIPAAEAAVKQVWERRAQKGEGPEVVTFEYNRDDQ